MEISREGQFKQPKKSLGKKAALTGGIVLAGASFLGAGAGIGKIIQRSNQGFEGDTFGQANAAELIKTPPSSPNVEVVLPPQEDASPTPEVLQKPQVTQQALDYFNEIAFGFENGRDYDTILKWVNNPKIKILGSPSEEDLQFLRGVIDELNGIVSGIQLEEVVEDENIRMYFGTMDEFKTMIDPGMTPYVNDRATGFFLPNVRFSQEHEGMVITSADIFVSTGVSEQHQKHIIREELTQSLGLGKDSYTYADSIFQQAPSDVIEFSPLDRQIISLLYNPAVKPGFTQIDVENVVDIVQ